MKTNNVLLKLYRGFFSRDSVPAEITVVYPDISDYFEPRVFLICHKILRIFIDIVDRNETFITRCYSQNLALSRHSGIFVHAPYSNRINSAVFQDLSFHCIVLRLNIGKKVHHKFVAGISFCPVIGMKHDRLRPVF